MSFLGRAHASYGPSLQVHCHHDCRRRLPQPPLHAQPAILHGCHQPAAASVNCRQPSSSCLGAAIISGARGGPSFPKPGAARRWRATPSARRSGPPNRCAPPRPRSPIFAAGRSEPGHALTSLTAMTWPLAFFTRRSLRRKYLSGAWGAQAVSGAVAPAASAAGALASARLALRHVCRGGLGRGSAQSHAAPSPRPPPLTRTCSWRRPHRGPTPSSGTQWGWGPPRWGCGAPPPGTGGT
jgi:hypothetical protein